MNHVKRKSVIDYESIVIVLAYCLSFLYQKSVFKQFSVVLLEKYKVHKKYPLDTCSTIMMDHYLMVYIRKDERHGLINYQSMCSFYSSLKFRRVSFK